MNRLHEFQNLRETSSFPQTVVFKRHTLRISFIERELFDGYDRFLTRICNEEFTSSHLMIC